MLSTDAVYDSDRRTRRKEKFLDYGHIYIYIYILEFLCLVEASHVYLGSGLLMPRATHSSSK